ncbi:hypothetical protein C1646_755436 [Rhizophagus diaphanus]|nr:hypothetical protein C1646_755436 [Rhizophagus diaphanus] [Rhizophagus sp. MUCL 43196]
MEWCHIWKTDYKNHKRKHESKVIELSEYLLCEICHPIEGEIPVVCKKFWEVLFKFEATILAYNNVTLTGLLNLLSIDNRIREDTVHKGECRNITDRIIESIIYWRQCYSE